MKKYGKYLPIAFFGLLISISSCTKDYYVIPDITITDTVSFANDVLPIFSTNCALSGCHITGGIAPDLSPINAYDNLNLYSLVDTANPEESTIYIRMNSTSSPMPPSGNLQPLEIATVLAWIEQGANNN